jgi:hypothetical protein
MQMLMIAIVRLIDVADHEAKQIALCQRAAELSRSRERGVAWRGVIGSHARVFGRLQDVTTSWDACRD